MKKVLQIFLFLSTAFSAVGQGLSSSDRKAFADEMLVIGEFNVARQIYLELLEIQESADNQYRLGLCITEMEDEIKALPYFLKAEELGQSTSISHHLKYDRVSDRYFSFDLDFNIGRGYHLTEDFALAVKYYTKYLAGNLDMRDRADAERLLAQAQNAVELMDNSDFTGKIVPIGHDVNSDFDEYAPLVSQDSSLIIFTRRQPNTHYKSTNRDGTFKEDIFITQRRQDGKWFLPYPFDSRINRKTKDDRAVSLNESDTKLIIKYEDGGLHEVTRNGNNWSEPIKLSKNINSRKLDVALTRADEVMIVASDRSGTYGGLDLFVSTLGSDGKWTDLVPLGEEINTGLNENSPFLDPIDKTLYFSSQGHNSMGGYDVFRARFNPTTSTWDKAENIGYPINSSGDDLYFTYHSTSKYAYYSSHRKDSKGGLDIYKVDFNQAAIQTIDIEGLIVKNDSTKDPLEAEISIALGGGKQGGAQLKSDAKGQFKTVLIPKETYSLSVYKKGYFKLDTVLVAEQPKLEFALTPLVAGKVFTLVSLNFDRGTSELNKESYHELNKFYELLKSNPDLGVEVAGHTEIGGISSQNLVLSQERADKVKAYLVRRGIEESRLLAVGYGSRHPLTKKNTEADKSRNRRTELIVHIISLEDSDWKPFYE